MLLKEENFLTENKKMFYSPEHIWHEIKKTHSVEEISQYIQELINKYDIPFPYDEYSNLELKNEFARFKNEDVFKFLNFKEWINLRVQTDLPLSYKGKNIYIKRSLIGRPCSNAFMQYERMKAIYNYKKITISPLILWSLTKEKAKKDGILYIGYHFNFAIKHCDELNSSNLRASLRMSTGITSQFSTIVAKTIYTITQAKNVLDFSAGWGDRLIGALATDNIVSYTGIDPNTALHPRYEQIAKEYKHNKKTKFICSPAEDVVLEPNQFDLIFTSPPYFDLEIYSNEDTQSTNKFKKIEDWLEHFLFKMIEKSYSWIKRDGRLLLNISDYENNIYNQKMIEYAQSLGFIYEGVIGYELQVRPGGNTEGQGSIRNIVQNQYNNEAVFCEPIFIFAKGNPQDLMLSNPNSLF